MRTVRVGLIAGLAVAGVLGFTGEARGQARGAQQRVAPGSTGAESAEGRQGELLIDRFARRAGQALGLSIEQTRRLRAELQATRLERGRITARVRTIRQELAWLVREPAGDETRIAELLDEAMALEVRAAEALVDEQRRLAEFLTPVQRARVLWLRQRMAQAALDRPGSGGG